jgi:hypothetical protein
LKDRGGRFLQGLILKLEVRGLFRLSRIIRRRVRAASAWQFLGNAGSMISFSHVGFVLGWD